MENFELFIEPVALQDIQDAIDYYESKSYGLGEAFENELNIHLLSIKKVVFFQLRYNQVRCLPLKKFPYMIHYTVDQDQKLIIIRAVFNTHLDPKNWNKRNP